MKTNTKFLASAGIIAAVYIALTFVFAPISFGEVQLRVAEALTILPVFTPAAVPGLFVGCLLGNLLGGAVLPDVIFGSLATLVGAYFTRKLRFAKPWMATIPPVVASVNSWAFAPQSRYVRYSGIGRKSVAFSSLPAIRSAYSW